MRSPASEVSDVAQLSEDGRAWPPTAVVVRAARSGNLDGQRLLYEACHGRVYRLAYRMVGPNDAFDVSQQSFLQVFRNLGQFAGQSRFETWLFRIVLNECYQLRRQRARRPTQSLAHEPMDEDAGPERSADAYELLEVALARLEPELRSIFLLRETEHLSYAEIAKALQIAEGTVASRLNRARRELQRILIELGWEP